MTILLDTNVVLRVGPTEAPLPSSIREALVAAEQILMTPISRAEIAIKLSIGKLHLTVAEEVFWQETVLRLQAAELPFDSSHAGRMASLPLHHRDPFDRMIAAQCLVEDVALATTDPIFARYGVRVVS